MMQRFVAKVADDAWVCKDRLIGTTLLKESAAIFPSARAAVQAAREEARIDFTGFLTAELVKEDQ